MCLKWLFFIYFVISLMFFLNEMVFASGFPYALFYYTFLFLGCWAQVLLFIYVDVYGTGFIHLFPDRIYFRKERCQKIHRRQFSSHYPEIYAVCFDHCSLPVQIRHALPARIRLLFYRLRIVFRAEFLGCLLLQGSKEIKLFFC